MIQYLYLGRIGYDEALRLQQELVEARIAGRIGNLLLLLEHPPVLTLGRNAHRSNILASDELLAHRGITVHEINRGGDVTYHGPGQLVGYPIFDLRSLHKDSGARLGPVDYVRRLEEAIIRVCGHFGIAAFRIRGLTGVWCGGQPDEQHSKETPRGEAKVAAIGVHVARGVTSHGFAFNLTTNLDDFRLIVPCGIADHPVTSLARELGGAVELPPLEQMANLVARQFGLVFDQQVLAIEDLVALRRLLGAPPPPEDTPASPPPELDRLLRRGERPQSA